MKRNTTFKELLDITGEAYYQVGVEEKEATALQRINLSRQTRVAIFLSILIGNLMYFWVPNAVFTNIFVVAGAVSIGLAFLRTCKSRHLNQFGTILLLAFFSGVVWCGIQLDSLDGFAIIIRKCLVPAFIVSSLMSFYYLVKAFFTSK